jgi:hypothetical protein
MVTMSMMTNTHTKATSAKTDFVAHEMRHRQLVRLAVITLVLAVTFGFMVHTAGTAGAQTTTTLLPGGFQTTPVQFLSAVRKGDRDVLVSWVPPQNALSPVVRYRISAGAESAAALPNPSQFLVNSGVLNVTFKNLKVGSTYFFQVQPETNVGAGAPSELTAPITITDGSERKPLPASSVSVTVLSSTQAAVQWVPSPVKQGVTVTRYRVTTFPTTRTIDVPSPINTAALQNLKAGVTYYVQVQAISSEGKFSDPALSAAFATPLPVQATPAPTVPPTLATTTTSTTTTTILLPLPSPVVVPTLAKAARCTTRVWNPSLLGTPSRLQAGAPAGAYIWTDGRAIHLRTYNNSNTPVRFSGTVSANTSMPTAKFYLEPDADSVSIGRSAASFSFSSAYDIDSLRFDGRCVRSVTIRLYLNGQPMPPSQIFIGANNVNPSTSAFVLTR